MLAGENIDLPHDAPCSEISTTETFEQPPFAELTYFSGSDLFADLKRYTQSMETHRGEFANSALHHAWDYAVSYGSQVQAIKLSFDSELMMG